MDRKKMPPGRRIVGGEPETFTPITADEAASLLGISKQSLYHAARNDEIPCQRIGRRYIFVREALVRWALEDSHKRNSRR